MNIHILHVSDNETAVDPLDDGGADLVAFLAEFGETQRGFKNLRADVVGLHGTLIARARFFRRAESQLRKLAAMVIETVNEH